jgi:hypothetical protein
MRKLAHATQDVAGKCAAKPLLMISGRANGQRLTKRNHMEVMRRRETDPTDRDTTHVDAKDRRGNRYVDALARPPGRGLRPFDLEQATSSRIEYYNRREVCGRTCIEA